MSLGQFGTFLVRDYRHPYHELTHHTRPDFQSLTYEQIVRNLRIAKLLGMEISIFHIRPRKQQSDLPIFDPPADDAWQPGDAIPEPHHASSSTTPETLWEYKWGPESEELFGPYTGTEMRTWNEQVWTQSFARAKLTHFSDTRDDL